ncbi:MAG: hypothetical protein HYT20_02005 [Candidatus Nealsonbacteria bacterium]|nr:hypothetical protein [Candidatus Nealsonbacteria bacterium]
MQNLFDGYFYNPTKGNLTLDEVIKELFAYMAEKPDRSYEVVVGCDSPSEEEPHFPVVLLVLRKGEGGRFFIKKVSYPLGEKKFYNWKQRILEEVMLSCQFALLLREKIGKEVRYIHADVGEKGQTRDMVKEVVGLIRGNGFEPRIKPDSYAASVVADRFT